jgi:hypothetical protein
MKIFMTKTVDLIDKKYNPENRLAAKWASVCRKKNVLINPNQISFVEECTAELTGSGNESNWVLVRMQSGGSILVEESIESFWLKSEDDK